MSRTLDVDAQQRAFTAAARHGERDYRDTLEEEAPPETIGLLELWQGGLAVTLKTKGGNEVEISTKIISVLGVLLLACASCAFYLIYTTATVATAQRYEAEIRARDSAELKRDNAELRNLMRDYQAQVVSGFTTTQAYISAHSNKVSFITALLNKEQQRAVNEYDRTHPTPQPPSPDLFKWKPDNSNQLE